MFVLIGVIIFALIGLDYVLRKKDNLRPTRRNAFILSGVLIALAIVFAAFAEHTSYSEFHGFAILLYWIATFFNLFFGLGYFYRAIQQSN